MILVLVAFFCCILSSNKRSLSKQVEVEFLKSQNPSKYSHKNTGHVEIKTTAKFGDRERGTSSSAKPVLHSEIKNNSELLRHMELNDHPSDYIIRSFENRNSDLPKSNSSSNPNSRASSRPSSIAYSVNSSVNLLNASSVYSSEANSAPDKILVKPKQGSRSRSASVVKEPVLAKRSTKQLDRIESNFEDIEQSNLTTIKIQDQKTKYSTSAPQNNQYLYLKKPRPKSIQSNVESEFTFI